MKNLVGIIILAIIFATSLSASAKSKDDKLKEEIKKVLRENPDLILQTIREQSKEVLEILQKTIEKEKEARRLNEIKNSSGLAPALDLDRPVRGNPKAKVTIVEYSDFQCPYCARSVKVLDELLKKYKGKIRLFYKHLPLPSHRYARLAAEYFEAVSLQGHKKAWKFHDNVFNNQNSLNEGATALDRLAKDAGADMKRLKDDLKSPVVKARIEKDLAEVRMFGFSGTPTFVINGTKLVGAQPIEKFEEIIKLSSKKSGK